MDFQPLCSRPRIAFDCQSRHTYPGSHQPAARLRLSAWHGGLRNLPFEERLAQGPRAVCSPHGRTVLHRYGGLSGFLASHLGHHAVKPPAFTYQFRRTVQRARFGWRAYPPEQPVAQRRLLLLPSRLPDLPGRYDASAGTCFVASGSRGRYARRGREALPFGAEIVLPVGQEW